MDHGIDPAVVLLGLPGFRLLGMSEEDGEIVVGVETTTTQAWCRGCGVRARAKDRAWVRLRHLPSGGRPVQIRWWKRVWACAELGCTTKTWREHSDVASSRHVLTEAARRDACERVGRHGHTVSEVAGGYGVGWHTIMRAVREFGQPLIDDRDLETVTSLGLDETLFASAHRGARAAWCTGFVDLDRARIIDLVPGRSQQAVERWFDAQHPDWRQRIERVALDPHAGYAAALRSRVGHAQLVLDPFHGVGLGNRTIDVVRRRTQQDVFGHRGRKGDPLYGIRRLLLLAEERLTESGRDRIERALARFDADPWDEVWAAWQAKEALRHVYAARTRRTARRRLNDFYEFVREVDVPEITTLARTIRRWEHELLAFFTTGISNGITEALNALIKKIKRIGHGFRNFHNYKLRVLLYTGGVAWDTPSTVKLRGRRPRLVA